MSTPYDVPYWDPEGPGAGYIIHRHLRITVLAPFFTLTSNPLSSTRYGRNPRFICSSIPLPALKPQPLPAWLRLGGSFSRQARLWLSFSPSLSLAPTGRQLPSPSKAETGRQPPSTSITVDVHRPLPAMLSSRRLAISKLHWPCTSLSCQVWCRPPMSSYYPRPGRHRRPRPRRMATPPYAAGQNSLMIGIACAFVQNPENPIGLGAHQPLRYS